jgi:hypothetical protein
MGYNVNGRIEISLFINNVEYPLDPGGNLLGFLHCGWSTKAVLPTVHFMVTDVLHSLDQIELQDGIPLRVVVKPGAANTMTYNFRKFHHRKNFNGSAFEYEVDGYLDAPRYWAGTATGGMRGTSNDVLSQIASTCGLQYQGTSTNDSQLWMPRNRTFGEFSKKIAARGYSSDSSYMCLGVDINGTMFYQDVNNLPTPQTTLVLGQYVAGSYTANDYFPEAKSGLNNKMTGYQNTRVQQSMVGTNTNTVHNQITFTPDSVSPLFNAEVKTKMVQGYSTFSAIDVGNVHENYEKAMYQNMRFANLFSQDVQFLVSTPTPLTLFNTFIFSVDTDNQKQDIAYAGNYVLSAKAFLVTGATYVEKILGTRQGTNSPYTSG